MVFNNQENEQRAYRRMTTTDNCWAHLFGRDKIPVKNISLFGTCLILNRQIIDKDSTYQITVCSGSETITLTVSVIWSFQLETNRADSSGIWSYETGFRFINMDEDLKTSLEKFITRLNK